MVDLETDRPTMYSTYSDADSGWTAYLLRDVNIGQNRVVFDCHTDDTTTDDYVIELKQNPDMSYSGGSKNFRYEGVRAETETHVVLTGKWKSQGDRLRERGVFIAVLPKEDAV